MRIAYSEKSRRFFSARKRCFHSSPTRHSPSVIKHDVAAAQAGGAEAIDGGVERLLEVGAAAREVVGEVERTIEIRRPSARRD